MRISAVTVCVDYSDLLAKSIEVRRNTLDHFLVVTSYEDEKTIRLCGEFGIDYHPTDAFYRNGASFNKYLAMVEAIEARKIQDGFWSDWNLFLDADIVLPADWRKITEPLIKHGNLYGCKRVTESGIKMQYEELAGFFQLFHTSDPNVQREPLLETNWRHAGGGDSEFQMRWKAHQQHWLPFHVEHLGETGQNWWGKGKRQEMKEMVKERIRIRGISPMERL